MRAINRVSCAKAHMEHGDGGPRQHSMSRLRKADHWARELKKLCDEVADDRTGGCLAWRMQYSEPFGAGLEADAYSLWIGGTLKMEGEHWKAAMELFVQAQAIYTELAKASFAMTQIMYSSGSEYRYSGWECHAKGYVQKPG